MASAVERALQGGSGAHPSAAQKEDKLLSLSGKLPCPLFPEECDCGHVPLATITAALLDSEDYEHEAAEGADAFRRGNIHLCGALWTPRFHLPCHVTAL